MARGMLTLTAYAVCVLGNVLSMSSKASKMEQMEWDICACLHVCVHTDIPPTLYCHLPAT